jgi:hypothetical protein
MPDRCEFIRPIHPIVGVGTPGDLEHRSYLQHRNVGYNEYMRTCMDVIDAYFQGQKTAPLSSIETPGMPVLVAPPLTPNQIEAANAVAKGDEAIRVRYTRLLGVGRSWTAQQAAPAAVGKPTSRIFAELNADCVKSALDKHV